MIRFVGAGARPRIAPRGLAWSDTGESLAVRVESPASMDAIPEARSLPTGTLVFVLPEPARARGILSAFTRGGVSRHARCEALLLRGYVDIAAEVDAVSRLDLVFARVPRVP